MRFDGPTAFVASDFQQSAIAPGDYIIPLIHVPFTPNRLVDLDFSQKYQNYRIQDDGITYDDLSDWCVSSDGRGIQCRFPAPVSNSTLLILESLMPLCIPLASADVVSIVLATVKYSLK